MRVLKNPLRVFFLLAMVLLATRGNPYIPSLPLIGVGLFAILYLFFDLSDWLYGDGEYSDDKFDDEHKDEQP